MQAALSDVTLKTKGEVTLTDNVLKLEGAARRPAATPTPDQGATRQRRRAGLQGGGEHHLHGVQAGALSGRADRHRLELQGQRRPAYQQYCYFSRRTNEAKGQVEIKIDLAMDGKTLPQPQKSDVNLGDPGLELRLAREGLIRPRDEPEHPLLALILRCGREAAA